MVSRRISRLAGSGSKIPRCRFLSKRKVNVLAPDSSKIFDVVVVAVARLGWLTDDDNDDFPPSVKRR